MMLLLHATTRNVRFLPHSVVLPRGDVLAFGVPRNAEIIVNQLLWCCPTSEIHIALFDSVIFFGRTHFGLQLVRGP